MSFHLSRRVAQTTCLSALVLSLWGCQTTTPMVAQDIGPDDSACQVAVPSNGALARVRVLKGSNPSLSDETLSSTCSTLSRVGRALQEQGSPIGFEVIGPVSAQTEWNQVDNLAMRNTVLRHPEPDSVKLFITERITQCGSSVGYILGCTPATGRPFVFVKQHNVLQDWAPEWVIWAHELGHAVGLTHPDGARTEPTLPQRIMTYAPTPQSVQLDAQEPAAFARMQEFRAGGPVALSNTSTHEAAGAAVAAVAPQDVVKFVSRGGAHGVNLTPLSQLTDAELLPLGNMLRPGVQLGELLQGAQLTTAEVPTLQSWLVASNDDNAWAALVAQAETAQPTDAATRDTSPSAWLSWGAKLADMLNQKEAQRPKDLVAVLQSNAVSVMGDLGGTQTLDAVMQALGRQAQPLPLDARHLGITALGRSLARTRKPELAAFLGAASVPQFWCPDQANPSAECVALSNSSRLALVQGRSLPTMKSR